MQIALHTAMRPGGILWRDGDDAPWSSLAGASSWGAERLPRLDRWGVGHDRGGPADRPFRGDALSVTWHTTADRLQL